MTAEKTGNDHGESGRGSCSTECSSTTPHLGNNNDINVTNCIEATNHDGRNEAKKTNIDKCENDKFTSSSSVLKAI